MLTTIQEEALAAIRRHGHATAPLNASGMLAPNRWRAGWVEMSHETISALEAAGRIRTFPDHDEGVWLAVIH